MSISMLLALGVVWTGVSAPESPLCRDNGLSNSDGPVPGLGQERPVAGWVPTGSNKRKAGIGIVRCSSP